MPLPTVRLYFLFGGTSPMRKRSVLWVLVLAILLSGAPASTMASPEVGSFRCRLQLTLHPEGILGDPFDRWAMEFCAMLAPEIEYLSWPEGQLLSVDMQALNRSAFKLQLLSVNGRVAMSSSLMGEGQVLLNEGQAKAALALMDAVCGALGPDTDWQNADCTLTLNASRAAGQLTQLKDGLMRLAGSTTGDTWEDVRALGALSQTFAELAQKVPKGTPVLGVFVQYEPPEARQQPISDAAADAPEELVAVLSLEAPMAVLRAIADASALDSG